MAKSIGWLASAAQTTTQTSPDIDTQGFRSFEAIINITVICTGSVTVSINGKDIASGAYYNLITGIALVGNGLVRYRVTPGEIAAVANSVAVDVLPQVVQVVITANNANPVTYSADYELADPA